MKKSKVNINKSKVFYILLLWIFIFAVGLISKTFQNDTFYTIKIGKLIMENGIDMLDHFSFHSLLYTYPHWLYDVFIYLIYSFSGYTGIYISSIIIFLILLYVVFKCSYKITDSLSISTFVSIMCSLAVSGFVTARAQSITFILFALEILFIEEFIKTNKKRYGIGLLVISLIICNVHVAVWPFYYILFLPYIAEWFIGFVLKKVKKDNKFLKYLKNKFIVDDNINIKPLLIIIFLSLLTGLLTPIGDTPYTYLIKTMMGNSQKYIKEHQMITLKDGIFAIVIVAETLFLAFFSKIKLRDLLLVLGISFMAFMSVRHLSLLAVIGSICFARTFSIFTSGFNYDVDEYVFKFLSEKFVIIFSFVLVTAFSIFMLNYQNSKAFIDEELYPLKTTNYIKENIDYQNKHIFNEYTFGSYLLLNDIPVFIDSRADLYTKEFSGLSYDIFDDYMSINKNNYEDIFTFYDIAYILTYKKEKLNSLLKYDKNYKKIYDDKYFILYERLSKNEE